MDRDHILIGQQFDVRVTFRNTSQSTRTLQGKILCETVSYIGAKLGVVKRHEFSSPLGAMAGKRTLLDDQNYHDRSLICHF